MSSRKSENELQKSVNMINADIAVKRANLAVDNEELIYNAVRNSNIPLSDTIARIQKHPKNAGKSAEDILDILATKTRKGKAGEAIVASTFNENALKKGKLNSIKKLPKDTFAVVNPNHSETSRDVLVKRVTKSGKPQEIHAQEIKTGTNQYAARQSQKEVYKDIVTNKENSPALNSEKIKNVMVVDDISSKPYSEKQAIKTAKKVLTKQFQNKPAVSKIEKAIINTKQTATASGKSAASAMITSTSIEVVGDLVNGKKIDTERAKEIGKNAIQSGKSAAIDAVIKTTATKTVEKTILSKGGQTVAKKVIGKAASQGIKKNAGKIAGPFGGFLVDSGVDVVKCVRGEESIQKTAVNVGINGVNAALYVACPPVGIAMTVGRVAGNIFGIF